MTYVEARKFIDQANQYGSVLGLASISELMKRLGNPQDQLKILHVAGTNGKGSTTAFLASILASEGYLVGRYISPAVFSYEERIQISRRIDKVEKESVIAYDKEHSSAIITDFITKQGISEAIATIKPVCEAMVNEGLAHPTTFEIETAMAFLYLFRERVDYAVIEVGLGGRLDATNVIKQPVCSVITSISLDHMQYLGDSLEKIAGEKAGIIKHGAPVITGNTNPEIIRVLQDKAKELETILTVVATGETEVKEYTPEGTSFLDQGVEYDIRLLGEHQTANAVLAVRTAKLLQTQGLRLSDHAIREGLRNTVWRGRFEIIARNPYVIIDGAHNEDAAKQLKQSIERYFKNRKIIFLIGVFADKDYRKILQLTAPLAEVIITLASKNSRALASDELAGEAMKYTEKEVLDGKTAEAAIRLAHKIAKKDDVIIAFGSLSFLEELCEAVISPELSRED